MTSLTLLAQTKNAAVTDVPWPVIAALAAGLVAFGLLMLIVKRYKRCPSNRVLVIYEGRIAGEVAPELMLEFAEIGMLMTSGRLDGDGFVEALALWEQLSKSGFIQGSYTGENKTPTQDDVNLAPRNAFNGFLMLFSSSDYFDTSASPSQKLNLVLGTGIPVNVIAELDRKIDDGLPQSGVVRQAVTDGGQFGSISQSKALCVETGPTPDIWDIAKNEQNCNGVYLY